MIQALIGPVTGLLDKFIEDKDQKAKLAHEIATMSERHMQEQIMGQLEINKAEAQHKSIFVAGWRPFRLVSVFCHGLALYLAPVTMFVCSYFGVDSRIAYIRHGFAHDCFMECLACDSEQWKRLKVTK